jgi:hypothetical protein
MLEPLAGEPLLPTGVPDVVVAPLLEVAPEFPPDVLVAGLPPEALVPL